MNKNIKSGFTIVELLVVIVIIGVLATITLVSFNGVSQKATVASLQSDLINASSQLRMYQINNNAYPTAFNSSYCPTAPVSDDKYCIKVSSGNSFDYQNFTANNSSKPQAFTLTIKNGSTSYEISEDTVPHITPAALPVSATGGNTVADAGGNRVHTFTSGGNFTVTTGGNITVSVNAGGGGGGACYMIPGGGGGLSSIKIGTDTEYVANGGGGGGDGYGDTYSDNSPGSTTPKEITGTTGGAVNGGLGATGCGDGDGSNGGAGGKVSGVINIASGKVVTVVVGAGGSGGVYSGYPSGQAGGPGSVTFTYAL